MIGRTFRRLSLPVQLWVWIGVLAVLAMAIVLLMHKAMALSQTLQQARTVGSMAESVSAWASEGHGIWVLDDSDTGNEIGVYLDVLPASVFQPRADPPDQIVTFHHKAPEVAVRELSVMMAKAGGSAQFHIASDRLHNLQNTPDRFELTAIGRMRLDSGETEYFEVTGDRVLYARRLVASAACLQCHDTADRAPQALRTKYPGAQAWGFKAGATVGVVSVSVPIPPAAASGVMSFAVWLAVAVAGIAIALLVAWLHGVIRSTRLLLEFADRVVHATTAGVPVARVDLDVDEHESRNELHRLSARLKAMYRALQLAQADRV